jgi:hypothetical protein
LTTDQPPESLAVRRGFSFIKCCPREPVEVGRSENGPSSAETPTAWSPHHSVSSRQSLSGGSDTQGAFLQHFVERALDRADWHFF